MIPSLAQIKAYQAELNHTVDQVKDLVTIDNTYIETHKAIAGIVETNGRLQVSRASKCNDKQLYSAVIITITINGDSPIDPTLKLYNAIRAKLDELGYPHHSTTSTFTPAKNASVVRSELRQGYATNYTTITVTIQDNRIRPVAKGGYRLIDEDNPAYDDRQPTPLTLEYPQFDKRGRHLIFTIETRASDWEELIEQLHKA